ncbi:MAG: hypothetical protein CMH84_14325 [Nocardioides sp.]|nr:hypothetical protein [Nocardioides sp.]
MPSDPSADPERATDLRLSSRYKVFVTRVGQKVLVVVPASGCGEGAVSWQMDLIWPCDLRAVL